MPALLAMISFLFGTWIDWTWWEGEGGSRESSERTSLLTLTGGEVSGKRL